MSSCRVVCTLPISSSAASSDASQRTNLARMSLITACDSRGSTVQQCFANIASAADRDCTPWYRRWIGLGSRFGLVFNFPYVPYETNHRPSIVLNPGWVELCSRSAARPQTRSRIRFVFRHEFVLFALFAFYFRKHKCLLPPKGWVSGCFVARGASHQSNQNCIIRAGKVVAPAVFGVRGPGQVIGIAGRAFCSFDPCFPIGLGRRGPPKMGDQIFQLFVSYRH